VFFPALFHHSAVQPYALPVSPRILPSPGDGIVWDLFCIKSLRNFRTFSFRSSLRLSPPPVNRLHMPRSPCRLFHSEGRKVPPRFPPYLVTVPRKFSKMGSFGLSFLFIFSLLFIGRDCQVSPDFPPFHGNLGRERTPKSVFNFPGEVFTALMRFPIS